MRIRRPLCTVCLFFVLTVALFDRIIWQGENPRAGYEGGSVVLSGEVYAYQVSGDKTVLRLKNLNVVQGDAHGDLAASKDAGLQADQPALSKTDKCICYCETVRKVPIGSIVLVRGEADGFSGARNPGEFDYARYYRTQEIAFCLRSAEIIEIAANPSRPGRMWGALCDMLFELRERAGKYLRMYLGEKDAGIMSAMLLGDKSMLSEEVRTLYSRSGIAHLLAISGVHISLIGMSVYRLLRKLGTRQSAAMTVSGVLILLYGIMTGMSPSAQRALIMFLIGMNAERIGRTYDMKTALMATMTALLMLHPRMIGSAACQFSFAAVFGIAFLAPVLTRICALFLDREVNKLPRAVPAFLSSLAVSLATLPLILAQQYEYAAYGMFFNAAALPLAAVLIPAGMCVIFFGALRIRVAARLAGFICRVILLFYEKAGAWIASLPGNLIRGYPGRLRICMYLLLLMLFAFVMPMLMPYRKKMTGARRRGMLVASVAYILILLAILLVPLRSGLRITVLDVGQGDGICIEQMPGHAILIDCGSTSQPSLLEKRLLPFLKYEGIYELDAVFLSHLDKDHVSAVIGLLRQTKLYAVRVRTVVIARGTPRDDAYEALYLAAKEAGAALRTMNAGDHYVHGELTLTCLSSSADAGGADGRERNGSSLILRLDYGEFSALFMGDAGEKEELGALALREAVPSGGVDLLKVAHHGSRYSSGEEFLERTHPRIAVISCGQKNVYGHPHMQTLERLCAIGAAVYRTDECGAVTVTVNGRRIRVRGYVK